jgi:hypothetical protein
VERGYFDGVVVWKAEGRLALYPIPSMQGAAKRWPAYDSRHVIEASGDFGLPIADLRLPAAALGDF